MTTSLSWNDGTTDKLYLTYTASEGNQTIAVTSDAHTGYIERSRDVVFTVTAGGTTISRTLTVTQLGKDITIIIRNDVYSVDNDVAVGYE